MRGVAAVAPPCAKHSRALLRGQQPARRLGILRIQRGRSGSTVGASEISADLRKEDPVMETRVGDDSSIRAPPLD